MPFIKISGLTTATAVSATNQFEINQNSTSRSATVAQVAAFARGTATDTVVLSAGTVSAPALTFTGDTNTGIYSPAADTIAFTEGGVEAMRIDSNANVGIGETSITEKLVVRQDQNASTRTVVANQNAGASCEAALRLSAFGASWDVAAGSTAKNSNSFTIGLSTGELMRITAGGNVGIGTSSPAWRLTAVGGSTQISPGTSAQEGIRFTRSTGVCTINGINNDNNAYNALSFATGAAEAMRITTGGEVYIAGTTDQGAYNLQVNGTGVWGAGAYVNGSDARIKDDIAPLASGLDVVAKLKPVQFRYKESWSKDTSLQPGFIAQELQAALADQPYVDGVVLQGPEYMSVAYQSLIPLLTKAIQELKADNDALKARVAALENK